MRLGSSAAGESATIPLEFDSLPAEVPAGLPLDIVLRVLSPHGSNNVVVERRSDGRDLAPLRGERVGDDPTTGAQSFRLRLPPLAEGETVELLPVVSRVGMVIQRMSGRATRGVVKSPVAATPAAAARPTPSAAPRYALTSEFLGGFTNKLVYPPESLGPGPDGLRINYSIEAGEIRGPKLNGKVRGGDWMILRQDGIGVAESRITYETDDGALLLSRCSGILDFGQDGYERALRNDFDQSPPIVLTPQFTTSHPAWLWLNRLQCIAVGRASMKDLMVRLDVYAIRPGPLLTGALQP